ncbi:cupin domain-containing protein [Alkalihalobacillus hwajinpoensis]|uniref:sugar phosphate nucleotidyltransferase n=1 Tax=Guptibacillus hwajinpoensis TaxID=208199 RepID=UPI001883E6EC|nr:sugar phosphate nucleotidyltransferase [Pseudalkalibacillus hwajinpoensis]MBF0705361.1 cupin domain-containing protein [Pseudalkalibacillus hwajinpoensis]
MKLVLLSGGSGKRLWPLSNDSRSKQFLKVLKNRQGGMESMVQRVWKQLKAVNLDESAFVATSKSQVDMIQNQLGGSVPLIIEPERRDTFPAIALAATYLYSIAGVGLNEVIGVLPVDPYVHDNFFRKVKELEEVLKKSDAELALLGVEPTYPSSKYGYIIPELPQKPGTSGLTVSHFKEKPSETEAEGLIQQKALWNCGVFAFKLDYIINLLVQKGLPIHYEELSKQYSRLLKTSFDYEVVEKAEKIIALPYSGSWKDLGTWNTLTEEMSTLQIGKGKICDESSNTHIVNELDIPVTVLGIQNAVVAVSPDGILVTDKSSSPRVKDLIKDLVQRPMFEERRWGWYRVLDHVTYSEGNEVLTKRIGVFAGKNISYQRHGRRSEVWTILKGEGLFAINDEIRLVKAGDVLEVPVGSNHGLKALSDMEFIEVQTGIELVEEDIERLYLTWEDIEAHCEFSR